MTTGTRTTGADPACSDPSSISSLPTVRIIVSRPSCVPQLDAGSWANVYDVDALARRREWQGADAEPPSTKRPRSPHRPTQPVKTQDEYLDRGPRNTLSAPEIGRKFADELAERGQWATPSPVPSWKTQATRTRAKAIRPTDRCCNRRELGVTLETVRQVADPCPDVGLTRCR